MRNRRMNAYYYGFDETGCDPIDNLLESVAIAGKGSHHTDCWSDSYNDEESAIDVIQRVAQEGADSIKRLADPWISVEDDEPPYNDDLWVYDVRSGGYGTDRYLGADDNGILVWSGVTDWTHFQPITPPKET